MVRHTSGQERGTQISDERAEQGTLSVSSCHLNVKYVNVQLVVFKSIKLKNALIELET